MTISQPSLVPVSEINIFPESSLCVDFGKSLAPKFPIKNRPSTVLCVIQGVGSHLFVTISQPSLVQFSEINIFPEISLCVDFVKSLAPQFPNKNRPSTVLRVIQGVGSHLFVTWGPSYSKIYVIRIPVVHQLKTVAIILWLLDFFMCIVVVLCSGLNRNRMAAVILKEGQNKTKLTSPNSVFYNIYRIGRIRAVNYCFHVVLPPHVFLVACFVRVEIMLVSSQEKKVRVVIIYY